MYKTKNIFKIKENKFKISFFKTPINILQNIFYLLLIKNNMRFQPGFKYILYNIHIYLCVRVCLNKHTNYSKMNVLLLQGYFLFYFMACCSLGEKICRL